MIVVSYINKCQQRGVVVRGRGINFDEKFKQQKKCMDNKQIINYN